MNAEQNPLSVLGPALDTAIEEARKNRDASRLSAELINFAIHSCETAVSRGLDGYVEHVPEPEPNPNRMIGYQKYDKEGFVKAYDQLKPIRDLLVMLREYKNDLDENRRLTQSNYDLLVARKELLEVRARLQAQLALLAETD